MVRMVRMIKKVRIIIAILAIDLSFWLYRNWMKLVLVLATAAWLVVINFPDNKVRIVFCSAGQGDETLIQRGFIQILIDGSRPGRALDCLRKHVPFFDRQIELMVVSHPQTDHFGGLIDVIKRYKVISFVYNGLRGDSREWEEFSRAVLAEGAEIGEVVAGDEVRVGELKLKVLWPEKRMMVKDGLDGKDGNPPNNPNNPSPLNHSSVLGAAASGELNSSAVVMDFIYGDFDALFTGDIGEEEEEEIIKKLKAQKVKRLENLNSNLSAIQPSSLFAFDVLKVAHHGSKYSSSLDFLKAVKPALAVIEVGKNSYGHPTSEALARLKEVGARVMRTDRDGDVVVETDGERWDIKKDKKFLIFNFSIRQAQDPEYYRRIIFNQI